MVRNKRSPPKSEIENNGPGEAAPVTSVRKQRLLDISAGLFAIHGYRATSVRDIGKAAGMLSGSLYHHFDAKEAILDEILSSYLADLVDAYAGIAEENSDPVEALRELVRAGFASIERHHAAVMVLQNEWEYLVGIPRFDYLAESEVAVQRTWVGVIERCAASGAMETDLDAKTIYRLLRDAMWVSVRWFKPGAGLSSRELADQYIELTFGGLLPR